MKSCFLFGHRYCSEDILPEIEQAVERLYTTKGVVDFYVGSRGVFDSLATTAVKRVKKKYPDMKLYLVLAYHPAERPVELTVGFDGSYYPPLENVPRPYAIVRANRYMVDTADVVICYVKHPGNARELLAYARRRKKEALPVENLGEQLG